MCVGMCEHVGVGCVSVCATTIRINCNKTVPGCCLQCEVGRLMVRGYQQRFRLLFNFARFLPHSSIYISSNENPDTEKENQVLKNRLSFVCRTLGHAGFQLRLI